MPFERAADLPSYEQPPVNEVAVGIGYKRLRCWDSVAPGEFRKLVLERYPKVEEQAPLAPLPPALGANLEMELTDLPPIRRTWYLSDDERTLIQIQEDRIHVNWRRVQEADVYPRYGHVLAEFESALKALERFAAERGEQINVTAGEVTYVNHIAEGELWSEWNDLSGVLADWCPTPKQVSGIAGLAATISMNSVDSHGLVSPGHYMSLELKSAQRQNDQAKVLVFQLVNRGPVESTQFESIREWCGRASEDIVRGFTALTTERAHQLWRRIR